MRSPVTHPTTPVTGRPEPGRAHHGGRLLTGLGAIALVGGLLAGCSSGERPQTVATGDVSDAVAAADFSLDRTTITADPDASPDAAQLTIGTRGDGRWVDVDGDAAVLGVSMFSLTTGQSLGQATELPAVTASFLRDLNSPVYTAVADAMGGLRVGDVFTLVVPDVPGGTGASSSDSTDSSSTTGTVVVIGRVDDAFPARSHGTEQAPVAGFPQVVRDTTGRPGLVLPTDYDSDDAPESAVLVRGDGDVTPAVGDTVYLQMTFFDTKATKRSAKVVQSTWETGQLTSIDLTDDAGDDILSVIGRAITAAPIGSQIIVHVPEDYQTQMGDLIVLDTLGVAPADDTDQGDDTQSDDQNDGTADPDGSVQQDGDTGAGE